MNVQNGKLKTKGNQRFPDFCERRICNEEDLKVHQELNFFEAKIPSQSTSETEGTYYL